MLWDKIKHHLRDKISASLCAYGDLRLQISALPHERSLSPFASYARAGPQFVYKRSLVDLPFLFAKFVDSTRCYISLERNLQLSLSQCPSSSERRTLETFVIKGKKKFDSQTGANNLKNQTM